MANRVITKKDLKLIVDMARENYIFLAKVDLTEAEFLAKCYLEASAHVLNLGPREYEERIPHEPNED